MLTAVQNQTSFKGTIYGKRMGNIIRQDKFLTVCSEDDIDLINIITKLIKKGKSNIFDIKNDGTGKDKKLIFEVSQENYKKYILTPWRKLKVKFAILTNEQKKLINDLSYESFGFDFKKNDWKTIAKYYKKADPAEFIENLKKVLTKQGDSEWLDDFFKP